MTDIAELIKDARIMHDRFHLWPKESSLYSDLADALERLDQENQALAATLNARIT